MRQWFAGKTAREQALLVIGGGIAVLAFLGLIVIEPLIETRMQTVENLERRTALLAWLEPRATEAAQLRQNPLTRARATMADIEASLTRSDLGAALVRLSPAAQDRIEAEFESAAYDDLIRWIEVAEAQLGLSLITVRIEPAGAPGLVNASLISAR